MRLLSSPVFVPRLCSVSCVLRFLVSLSVNYYSVGPCPNTLHNQVNSILHGRVESHKTVCVHRGSSRIISRSLAFWKEQDFKGCTTWFVPEHAVAFQRFPTRMTHKKVKFKSFCFPSWNFALGWCVSFYNGCSILKSLVLLSPYSKTAISCLPDISEERFVTPRLGQG